MKSIAYSRKNYLSITFRYFKYCLYKALVMLSPQLKSKPTKAYLVPTHLDSIAKEKLKRFLELTGFLIESTDRSLAQELGLRYVEKATLEDDSTLVLLMNFNLLYCLLNFKNLKKFRILDNNFWSSLEVDVWIKVFNELSNQELVSSVAEKSSENFKRFQNSIGNSDSAVCFTTGPSFDEYRKFTYDQDLKIICNSIVKDKEFLAHIHGPDVLVFADPVFHFGLNPYAEVFRNHVKEVMETYSKCYIFTILENATVLQYLFPQFQDRIVGLRVLNSYNFLSSEKLTVYPTANILTLLMLPVASSFARNVKVIGADGRDKKEKYFWQHNNRVQLENQMNLAFLYHPSFFRDRVYKKYYENHCKQLEIHVSFIESHGKKVISLTKSKIPVLLDRYRHSQT